MTAEEIVRALGLVRHPEGGYFRETYRHRRPDGGRGAMTAIYFLLNAGEHSRWHVVSSAELWLWHAGGPLTLRLGGSGDTPMETEALVLGIDLAAGQRPQLVVPGGVWQSAAPAGDEAVLVSCVVSPGFDFADFRLAP